MTMDNTTILGLLAGTLTSAAFFPQLLQAWRTKSVKDVSLAMYIVFCLGITLWLIYGVLVNSLPVILANIVTLSMAAAILYLKIRYR
jgi:MtN3 and saliva related transmembrane protein